MAPGRERTPSNLVRVDDPDDPRLNDFREVRDRDAAGPGGRPGLFIAEAALVVERMLRIPGLTRSMLIAPRWVERLAPLAPPEIPVYVAPGEVLNAVAGFDIHRGVLAVGYRPPPERLTLDAAVPRRAGPLSVLICEDLNNVDNVGLVFRNAAAFAVDAVVLSPRCHDPLYRKSIRVSAGCVFAMPWARAAGWPGDLERLRRDWGLTLVGAHTGPEAQPLDETARPERVGVVVGQEHEGLSAAARGWCDALVRIPMAAGVDSLNVGVATAVVLHRFTRGARV